MKIDERKFPILGCIEKNKITDKINDFLENSDYSEQGAISVRELFPFFTNKTLQINYISSTIHDKLYDIKNFIKAKSLLLDSSEMTGLLLLPETILPNFNVTKYVDDIDPKNYPVNAVLYSWLSANNHDKIRKKTQLEDLKKRIEAGEKQPSGADWDSLIEDLQDEEDSWEDDLRTLVIIPIHNYRFTQATESYYSIAENDCYGDDYNKSLGGGGDWYGNIFDYVMSFILFYNYTEAETHIAHGIDTGESRRIKLNNEKFLNETPNNVEIIDITYFTKLIRTSEFGVRGHFRVQHYGTGLSESKIIFIDDYKKGGYTRGAKIDKK